MEIEGVRKAYGGLARSACAPRGPARRTVALRSTPPPRSFANLLTGATLPDEGEVPCWAAGDEIGDERAWLASLDRFGIVSARAVLLGG